MPHGSKVKLEIYHERSFIGENRYFALILRLTNPQLILTACYFLKRRMK